jgi:hypothetical protein
MGMEKNQAPKLFCYIISPFLFTLFSYFHHKQQQQQHNLFSQARWGKLEMKPKRDEKQGDT